MVEKDLIKVRELVDRFLAHIDVSISLYKDEVDIDFSRIISLMAEFEVKIKKKHRIAGEAFMKDMKERISLANEAYKKIASREV